MARQLKVLRTINGNEEIIDVKISTPVGELLWNGASEVSAVIGGKHYRWVHYHKSEKV